MLDDMESGGKPYLYMFCFNPNWPRWRTKRLSGPQRSCRPHGENECEIRAWGDMRSQCCDTIGRRTKDRSEGGEKMRTCIKMGQRWYTLTRIRVPQRRCLEASARNELLAGHTLYHRW